MPRGICEWILDGGERCKKEAEEGFSLCGGTKGHLAMQRNIAQTSTRNSKHFAAVSKNPSECGAPTVLEEITKKTTKDQLSIVNQEAFPDTGFFFSRNNARSTARHGFNGYRVVKVGKGDNRPVVGEGAILREGFEHQVNDKGEVVLGDLILMECDRKRRDKRRKESQETSRSRTSKIYSDGDKAKTDQAIGNHRGIKAYGQRGEIDIDRPLSPPQSTKKSYVVNAQLTS